MKKIIHAGLFGFSLMLAACGASGGDQQGEVKNEQPSDVNKHTVEEAQQINDDKDSLKSSCTDFVTQAAHDGMNEVELARLANERAVNKEVKAFAQRMLADHGKANAELMELAKKKNITLPTETDNAKSDKLTLSSRNAEQVTRNAKGDDFDRSYMDMMVDDHKKAVDLFEDASKDCEDAEIKIFASQKLDILKQHLKTAETIQETLKKKNK